MNDKAPNLTRFNGPDHGTPEQNETIKALRHFAVSGSWTESAEEFGRGALRVGQGYRSVIVFDDGRIKLA